MSAYFHKFELSSFEVIIFVYIGNFPVAFFQKINELKKYNIKIHKFKPPCPAGTHGHMDSNPQKSSTFTIISGTTLCPAPSDTPSNPAMQVFHRLKSFGARNKK